MLPVLWVEDQEGEVNKYGPVILNEIAGIELHLLYLGQEPAESEHPGIRIHELAACQEMGGASLDFVSQKLCETYKEVQPWLVLMDLALDSIRIDSSVFTLGDKTVPGVNLTLDLYERYGVQNVVFLSNFGESIYKHLKLNKTGIKERGWCTVLRWPKTYFLDKPRCWSLTRASRF